MTEEPTTKQATSIQLLYNLLNEKLFNGEIENCILNYSRESARTMGFFAPERWIRVGTEKERAAGEKRKVIHEISLNPRSSTMLTVKDLVTTIAHEMVHLWQHEKGTPSRTGYHNEEWAAKCESIGLIPSSTGRPGGKKTGQKMSDYVAPGGPLEEIIKAIEEGKVDGISYVAREAFIWKVKASGGGAPGAEREESGALIAGDNIEEYVPTGQQPEVKKNKTRYVCPSCGAKVWGRPELEIQCIPCNKQFEEA